MNKREIKKFLFPTIRIKYIRSKYKKLKSVIVTGSIGKTSTKEMISSVLKEAAPTLCNVGSVNSARELSRLIFDLNNNIQYICMELGLRSPTRPFEPASEIVVPDAVVITNIGNSHIENFKNKAHILEHKLSATKAMNQKDGVLFLNGDDNLLYNSKYDFKTVFFGIKNPDCDYVAFDIKKMENSTTFKVKSKDGSPEVTLEICTIGEHNILNALAAYALAKHFGINVEIIKAGIKKFKTKGIRQNVIKVEGKSTLIVDCYNATPESMLSGLEMLKDIKVKGRKIAVLGHMMRLGRLSEELHRKVGRDVSEYNLDLILTFGLDAYYIAQEAKKLGQNVHHFYSKQDLIKYLKDYAKETDAILFKGVEKFHNFQDLYLGFSSNKYNEKDSKYIGAYKDELICHTDSVSAYFGNKEKCFLGKNINEKVYIKDLAILFAIPIIMEKISLNENVVISKDSALKHVSGSVIRFNPTNIFSVKDLIYASIFKSSFEAIYSLIERVFGEYENFENSLNSKFNELGIKNTKIKKISNKQNKETYTTAYDINLFLQYAFSNPEFREIVKSKEYVLNNLKTGKQTKITPNNKLLRHEKKVSYIDYYYEPALNIKAENIYDDSNYLPNKSLISCIEAKDEVIFGIILGSEDFYYCNNSYLDMRRILDKCISG